VERERERERPPASCPGFVYNKKLLFDVVSQPAPKLPLPQDVLRVKMPDGGHCWMTSTSPHGDSEHSPPEASGDFEKYIKQQQQFDAVLFCVFLCEKCVRTLLSTGPVQVAFDGRKVKGNSWEQLIVSQLEFFLIFF